MGSPPGDCKFHFKFPNGVSEGMHGLAYTLITPGDALHVAPMSNGRAKMVQLNIERVRMKILNLPQARYIPTEAVTVLRMLPIY